MSTTPNQKDLLAKKTDLEGILKPDANDVLHLPDITITLAENGQFYLAGISKKLLTLIGNTSGNAVTLDGDAGLTFTTSGDSSTITGITSSSGNSTTLAASQSMVSAKQDALTAGSNITIQNNTISAIDTNELENLTDVNITTPTDGQGLVYNDTTQKWENGNVSSASSIDTLTDVNLTNLTNGQILKYNSTSQEWENANESGGGSGADEMTLAEYNALTTEQKNDGTIRFIPEATVGTSSAIDMSSVTKYIQNSSTMSINDTSDTKTIVTWSGSTGIGCTFYYSSPVDLTNWDVVAFDLTTGTRWNSDDVPWQNLQVGVMQTAPTDLLDIDKTDSRWSAVQDYSSANASFSNQSIDVSSLIGNYYIVVISIGWNAEIDNLSLIKGSTSGNPSQIKYMDKTYANNSGGGTTVVANPQDPATDTLTKIQIGNTIYEIEGGGSSSGGLISTTLLSTPITATGTYTLADSYTNYDFIGFRAGNGSNETDILLYPVKEITDAMNDSLTITNPVTNSWFNFTISGSSLVITGKTVDTIYSVIGYKVGGGAAADEMTLSEYNALTTAQKNDGTIRFIPESSVGTTNPIDMSNPTDISESSSIVITPSEESIEMTWDTSASSGIGATFYYSQIDITNYDYLVYDLITGNSYDSLHSGSENPIRDLGIGLCSSAPSTWAYAPNINWTIWNRYRVTDTNRNLGTQNLDVSGLSGVYYLIIAGVGWEATISNLKYATSGGNESQIKYMDKTYAKDSGADELTLSEYNALTTEQKNDGMIRFIPESNIGSSTAINMSYITKFKEANMDDIATSSSETTITWDGGNYIGNTYYYTTAIDVTDYDNIIFDLTTGSCYGGGSSAQQTRWNIQVGLMSVAPTTALVIDATDSSWAVCKDFANSNTVYSDQELDVSELTGSYYLVINAHGWNATLENFILATVGGNPSQIKYMDKTYANNSGGGTTTTVTVTPKVLTGTNIADITVGNGNTTDIYDYAFFDGSGYYETPFKVDTDHEYEIIFEADYDATMAVIGTYAGANYFHLTIYNNYWYVGTNSGEAVPFEYTTGKHTFKTDSSHTYLDNTQFTSYTPALVNNYITIGARENTYLYKGKFYEFKIKSISTGNILYDLVPGMRGTTKGLYDLVSDTFIECSFISNMGTKTGTSGGVTTQLYAPSIEANPSGTATDSLSSIEIDGTVYSVGGGGASLPNNYTVTADSLKIKNEAPSTGVDWIVEDDTDYFDSAAGITVSTRVYQKTNAVPALGGVYTIYASGSTWTTVMFTSTDATAVAYSDNADPFGSFTYLGHTWYFSGTNSAWSGDRSSEVSGARYIGDFSQYDYSTKECCIEAAKYLIDHAGVSFEGDNFTTISRPSTGYIIAGGGSAPDFSDATFKVTKQGNIYSKGNLLEDIFQKKSQELTSSQYENLTLAEKTNGTIYFINDPVPENQLISRVSAADSRITSSGHSGWGGADWHAFDGITGSLSGIDNAWCALEDDATPWIQYHFDTPYYFTKLEMKVYCHYGSDGKTVSMNILASNDGTNWDNISMSGTAVSVNFPYQTLSTVEFDLNNGGNKYEYIRIQGTEPFEVAYSYGCDFDEIYVYGTDQGSPAKKIYYMNSLYAKSNDSSIERKYLGQLINRVATDDSHIIKSSENSRYPAWGAFSGVSPTHFGGGTDPESNTCWLSTVNEATPYLGYHFDTPYYFTKIDIKCFSNYSTDWVHNIQVLGSKDGNNYENILAEGSTYELTAPYLTNTITSINLNETDTYSYIKVVFSSPVSIAYQPSCFVDEIYVYGGEIIENKKDLHTYSTTEQVIGTWVDGKTLYEKTYHYPGTLSAGPTYLDQTLTTSNVDYFTLYDMSYVVNSNYRGSGFQIEAGVVSGGIFIDPNNAPGASYSDIYVTVRYTKIT